MIFLLLAILSANWAFQGEVINLTLSEPATVYLDECMFFEHSLNSSENLAPGNYRIVLSYGCEGFKPILVKGAQEERLILEVKKLGNLSEELTKLQKNLIILQRENENLKSRASYLQSLVEIINSINVDLYDRIKDLTEKNAKLNQELEFTKSELQNCSKDIVLMNQKISNLQLRISELEKNNSELKATLKSTEESLKSSAFYSEIFKNSTLLLIATLVGIFLAFLRRY